MAKKQHSHANRPLGSRKPPKGSALPPNRYGGLVGELDHITLNPHDGPKPDDNHIYLWLHVPAGPVQGKYECAFNTESTDGASQSQYAVKEESIDPTDFPDVGYADATVSYAGLGLKQSDFQNITNGTLRTSVYDWAHSSALITAYGHTYSDGTGLHDIHMNSGEPKGSKFPNLVNQDGVLVFYYRPAGEAPFRRWVFIKFSTQTL